MEKSEPEPEPKINNFGSATLFFTFYKKSKKEKTKRLNSGINAIHKSATYL